MIKSAEIFPIGYVAKTHGIKGELNARLDTEYNPEDFRFVVFELDSIFIPFEIEYSRGKGEDNRLVKLKDVDTVEEARDFVGKTMYVLMRELREHPDFARSDEEEDGMYLSDLVGYTLFDENGTKVGEITGYNDDTLNYLLEVLTDDGRKIYIPYVDEWLISFNREDKSISFDLPNGITD